MDPFMEVIRCTTGDPGRPLGPDNQPRIVLAVRTSQGWWSQELARNMWPHNMRQSPQVAAVGALEIRDRLGGPGAELTAVAEFGQPGGTKTRSVFICGVGASGGPACAQLRIAAGGPFHGAGSLSLKLRLACDGTLDLGGWEGGSPVRLVHGRYRLVLP